MIIYRDYTRLHTSFTVVFLKLIIVKKVDATKVEILLILRISIRWFLHFGGTPTPSSAERITGKIQYFTTLDRSGFIDEHIFACGHATWTILIDTHLPNVSDENRPIESAVRYRLLQCCAPRRKSSETQPGPTVFDKSKRVVGTSHSRIS